MSLPGAPTSVVNLLRAQYALRYPAESSPDFALAQPTTLSDAIDNRVTVFVYSVGQDPTRRHSEVPTTVAGQLQRRVSLLVDVRFLLTAWMGDAEGELLVLARCMEILDDFPVLSGPLLSPAYTWDPEAILRVTLDHIAPDELLRLWDVLNPSFRLSVPYAIRTVRLSPRIAVDGPPVDAALHLHTPRATPGGS